MIGMTMDRVLFGDKQFFGVNHMPKAKVCALSMLFQELGVMREVFDATYQDVVRTFMCTAHDYGSRIKVTFCRYHDHVRKRYRADPNFIKMNVPAPLDEFAAPVAA